MIPAWTMGVSNITVAPIGVLTEGELVFPLNAPPVSSGFIPSNITGLILWLDATKIAGVSSGASLSTWTDSSASLSHATQPTANRQPAFVGSVQNGLSAVSFAGGLCNIISASSTSQPFTIAVTGSLDTATANRMFAGTAASTVFWRSNNADATKVDAFAGAAITNSGVTRNQWFSYVAIMNGASSKAAFNGTAVTGDVGSAALGPNCGVGSGANVNQGVTGAIGEVLLYGRAINNSELSTIASYLSTKWGTP